MIHEKLVIGKWKVDFLFAPEGYDTEEALTYLYFSDASDYIMQQAYHIFESDELNTGITFTNKDSKIAVVVIGPTSSGNEFINTFCHEMYHVIHAIIEDAGIDLGGEKPAYIMGDTVEELAEIVCRLGCNKCN